MCVCVAGGGGGGGLSREITAVVLSMTKQTNNFNAGMHSNMY